MKGSDNPEDKKRKERIERFKEAWLEDPTLNGQVGEAVKYVLFGPAVFLDESLDHTKRHSQRGIPGNIDNVLHRLSQPGELLDRTGLSADELARLKEIEKINNDLLKIPQKPRTQQPVPKMEQQQLAQLPQTVYRLQLPQPSKPPKLTQPKRTGARKAPIQTPNARDKAKKPKSSKMKKTASPSSKRPRKRK